MNNVHQPNWVEAGEMLREALERYRDLKEYENWGQVIDDVANYMPGRRGESLSTKTVQRDIGGVPIPDHRVDLYVQWLHDKAKMPRKWVAEWLEQTGYPRPGELLARVYEAGGNRYKLFASVKKNDPPSLRGYLWGRFLGREMEIEKAIRWADNRQHPIAVLWGFGGNGKTTLQLKLGEDFVYKRHSPLRWPFKGVIWVSALDYPTGLPSLLDILREVVKTFGPPENVAELGSVSPRWLKQEAKRLLKKTRVLILLDNFETVLPQNRDEILEFFGWLDGESKTLISSRHRLDLGNMAHMLIPMEGLQPEHAEFLIQDYLKAKPLSSAYFTSEDIQRLIEATQNNPKAIITVLGIMEEGISLSDLLNSITAGKPEGDRLFEVVFGKAWQDILTESDKAVLMAKSFFSLPVSPSDLARIAGVDTDKAAQSISKLRTTSFFERPQSGDTRVKTHPLAQDFARRILHDHSGFESQAEKQWWSQYTPHVVQQARRATYMELQADPELDSNVTNVLERLEKHLREHSPYASQAAEMFAGQEGLGDVLLSWGRWDEMLRLAEITLDFAIEQQNPRWIGWCVDFISDVHRERDELDTARVYVARASEENVTLREPWLEATIETERGDILRRDGKFPAAKQAYMSAVTIYQELGETVNIASILLNLGGVSAEIATEDLDEAIDYQWQENKDLAEAEMYFTKSERYWNQIEATDPARRFNTLNIRAWRGVLARVRGDLDEARRLFNGCEGQFRSVRSIARLYYELALVEHLLGNKDLAYTHEERGLGYRRQLGIMRHPPDHCYKVIERMKQERKW